MKNNNEMQIRLRNMIVYSPKMILVREAHTYLSSKYGNVVIAGGCMTDMIYNKEFYDIDVFIEYKDLKQEWKKDISERDSKRRICAVLRDKYAGIETDVIVIGIPMKDYISRFDMNLKIISYDGKNINVSEEAAKDMNNKEISLKSCENTNEWFRLYKASNKYGLKINKVDEYLLLNHLSCIYKQNGKIRVSPKYEQYLEHFKPLDNIDEKLGEITNNYMRRNYNYMGKLFVKFNLFKLAIYPYMKMKKLI